MVPMTKDNGCGNYAGQSYYIPRKYDPKRAYPWPTNVARLGISSNKKQAIEAAINRPYGLLRRIYPADKTNVSLGADSRCPSNLQQVRGGLVSRPSPSLYKAKVSLGTDRMSAGGKDFKDACQGDALVNSQNPNKILKAKVNNVLDSENIMAAPIRNSFGKVTDGRLLRTPGSNNSNGSFLASGHPHQSKYGNNTLIDVIRNEGLDRHLALGCNNEEQTRASVSRRADKGPMEDASRMVIAKNKAIVNYRSNPHLSGSTSQMNTVEPYAYQGEMVSANSEVMTNNQNSAQSLRATSGVAIVEPNTHFTSESNSNSGGNIKTQKVCRKKKLATTSEPKPNIYSLSNKSILSTGVLDGAPVSYTLRRRGIILEGVIKGPKILCSCNVCNNSKYIGVCKFERHAGGKTKKPYSCMYLKNGKTVNQVCEALRATPNDMLFHRLPEIAGSAFTWLSFNNWKGHSKLNSSPMAPPPIKMEHFESLQ